MAVEDPILALVPEKTGITMTIRRIYGTGVDEGVPIVVGTAAKPKREDVGERLLELRRTAFQKYYPDALWYVSSDATFAAMRGVADALRTEGDLEAAFLAAAILKEIDRKTGNAS